MVQIQGDAHQFRLITFSKFVPVQAVQFCKDVDILVAFRHMLYTKYVNRSHFIH